MGIVHKILSIIVVIRIALITITSRLAIGILLQLIFFIPLSIFILFFNKFPKKIQICLGCIFMIPLFFASFLAIYGNRSTATFDEDVLIVLGAGINVEDLSSSLARRLICSAP